MQCEDFNGFFKPGIATSHFFNVSTLSGTLNIDTFRPSFRYLELHFGTTHNFTIFNFVEIAKD